MQKTPKGKTAKDYEHLGRLIETTYLSGALDRKRLIVNNLLRGISIGFGGVIGATIVVALLLWILSFFNELPLVGDVSEMLKRTIERSENR